ncbi:MAG TPA: hypothetical protein VEC99_02805, partial [Clostridia bacterium]|nr:hypothetical protein [Clostridia bacterium]
VADSGKYTVIVSDNAGQVTSSPALLTVVTAAQASNILGNPGFESGVDFPWQRFNGGGLVATIIDVAGPLEGSAYASQTWGNGEGSWNGIFQDVPATPGQAFTANGSFLVSSEGPITGSSEAWLEVQFQNANGNMIGLYRSEHITSNTVTSTWMELQATNIIAFWSDYSVVGQAKYLVAPEGTAKVRYQVTYHAGDGGGAVYYDNMNLFLKAPVTVTASTSGNSIRLSFPTQIGVSYQILYKNELSDANWQVLSTVTGDLSGSVSVTDVKGTGKRFYSVSTL